MYHVVSNTLWLTRTLCIVTATRETELGAVGGAKNENSDHMTGSESRLIEEEVVEEEEEEVPIDEDLFAGEELENLDLEDVDLEPSAVD